ncbi:MAG: TIGR00159 family protein [Myxococcales bacterium]|nr:TIGR00159 family protein [Myxococcales bacterium]
MLDSVWRYFAERSPVQLARDALDVLIVYYVFYRALMVLRGTRAMQVGVGLGVVFLLYVVANVLQLATVLSVLGALISSIILVIVVVFQNDIRRGLQRVGSRALFGGWVRAQESKVIDEVVEAATELARHRIGAIITFEQDANLDEFVGVHKGHLLDAAVSRELLVSLFVPEGVNKLHDGSVIIRNYRIAKAGVFFPMPEGRVLDESFGSRHRAALGITEETDAVVVVVSEERGTISFCFNGNIASNLDGPKLRTMLEAIFSPKVRSKKKKTKRAEAEAPASSATHSERTRPPTGVRISEVEPVPEVERISAGPRSQEPERARDSEPPPAPLRPRREVPEDPSAASVRLPRAAPLLTPIPRVGLRPGGDSRPSSPDDDEKDDDESGTTGESS